MEPRAIQKARRRDRIARSLITAGGMLIIFTVIGIFFFIVEVAIPLFLPPQAALRSRFPAPPLPAGTRALAVGTDRYLETGFLFRSDGVFAFFDSRTGKPLERVRITSPGGGSAGIVTAELFGNLNFSVTWDDGSASVEQVRFAPRYDQAGRRTIGHEVLRLAEIPPGAGRKRPSRTLVRFDGERGLTRVSLEAGNRFAVLQRVEQEDLFGNKKTEDFAYELEDSLPGEISAFTLNRSGTALYAGTRNGFLLRWNLTEPGQPRLLDSLNAFPDRRGITALALVLGDNTLAVGDEKGGITAWFPVPARGAPGRLRLKLVHRLRGHGGPVQALAPSRATRSLASLGPEGRVHLDHVTNERPLLALEGERPLTAFGLSARFNGLIGLEADGNLSLWTLEVPHPEASWRAFFGEIWYESYRRPDYVWQSSSGDDEFEPKLSLVPLIFGTLKGTLYGMLFAVPLAVLGALYTSHLMQPRLRGFLKPAVEVMGSVPSVVIGFLAAVWLAPIVKSSLMAIFLMLGAIPLVVLLILFLWERAARFPPLRKIRQGYEFLVLAPAIVVAVYLCFLLGGAAERAWFGGDLPLWLFQTLGLPFDQRNSIVIAFALGFAAVPIVFTIADDALTNVPRHLTAASLALGASRWQTVWRVALPSASPGIFAAVMIGFGRVVGETMIVLMATGNTPILDLSPFNGMRTLSANIAVETPEAPLNGTLYRTLFLAAVVLFLVTFLLNSVAEVVRQRLRRKFGQY